MGLSSYGDDIDKSIACRNTMEVDFPLFGRGPREENNAPPSYADLSNHDVQVEIHKYGLRFDTCHPHLH